MSHKLSLAVQYASEVPMLPTRAQFRRWMKSALQRDASITLRIVDEQEGRRLNHTYRGKDYATNVLTFAYDVAEPTDMKGYDRDPRSIAKRAEAYLKGR